MRKNVNGKSIEMTADEIAAIEKELAIASAMERKRSLTAEEVIAMLIPMQINTLTVDDSTSLRMQSFYPEWASGVSYGVGFKVQYGGRLWRVVQAHTSQSSWNPESTPSLWEAINETHDGTMHDPIPYNGNMALEKGKHYLQDGEIYLCFRDSGAPVYHMLKELVDLYVTLI